MLQSNLIFTSKPEGIELVLQFYFRPFWSVPFLSLHLYTWFNWIIVISSFQFQHSLPIFQAWLPWDSFHVVCMEHFPPRDLPDFYTTDYWLVWQSKASRFPYQNFPTRISSNSGPEWHKVFRVIAGLDWQPQNAVLNASFTLQLLWIITSFNGSINSIHWENLINLEFVDFSYNQFDGGIPLSTFSLPLLELVALSNNKFSHQFYEFSKVSSYRLGALDLSFNNLKGPIPKFIFNLRGLEILLLSSNNFKQHKT